MSASFADVKPRELTIAYVLPIDMSSEAIDKAKRLLRAVGYWVVPNTRVLAVSAQNTISGHSLLQDRNGVLAYTKRTIPDRFGAEILDRGGVVWSEPPDPEDNFYDQKIIRGEIRVILPKPEQG